MNKETIKLITEYFKTTYPNPTTELLYLTPYQLTVAVILSAQCTDKRVNIITPDFFSKYNSFKELSKAKISDVYSIIKSCSYPNNKTSHLIGMAQKVVNEYGGKLPENTEELQKLPGVGRKSANVIASVAFKQNTMPVDTHVFRVSQRIGLVKKTKSTLEVEKQLLKIIPADDLHDYHHWLILHGRYICVSRKPKCEICGISLHCQYFNSVNKVKL